MDKGGRTDLSFLIAGNSLVLLEADRRRRDIIVVRRLAFVARRQKTDGERQMGYQESRKAGEQESKGLVNQGIKRLRNQWLLAKQIK